MLPDPFDILKRYYLPGTDPYKTLVNHSRIVMQISLDIAGRLSRLNPDLDFIRDAALLHDIGIFLTRAPSIGCTGEQPYVCHGYLGKKLLDELGVPPEYGRVCERHTGAGITRENILSNNLPLPPRDMVPVTLEEKIICFADKFHSKNPAAGNRILSGEQVKKSLEKIHPEHARRFSEWIAEFHLTEPVEFKDLDEIPSGRG